MRVVRSLGRLLRDRRAPLNLYGLDGRLVATGLVPAPGQTAEQFEREALAAWGLGPAEGYAAAAPRSAGGPGDE